MNAPVTAQTDPVAAAAALAAKQAAANAILKKKMHTATLVEKRIFGDGRMGIFKLHAADRFAFEAGQYTTLGLETPAGFVPRAYSFAGSPLDGGFEFFIALVDGGKLTPTIFAQEVGATFHYLSPKGKFTIRHAGKPTMVLVSTGTGLAPFVSQIRTLWKAWKAGIPMPVRVVLFHGSAHADEFGYREELEGYAAHRAEGFDLTTVFTASRGETERGWTPGIGKGRVNEIFRMVLNAPVTQTRPIALPQGVSVTQLRELIDPARTAVLACGNPAMLDDIREPIAQAGIGSYHVEEYWKA
jgi:ferredoxin--NADP+ reductase